MGSELWGWEGMLMGGKTPTTVKGVPTIIEGYTPTRYGGSPRRVVVVAIVLCGGGGFGLI